MRNFYFVFFIFSLISSRAQTICNSSGNLMLFTNYDGGTLTINVDQNIPNLKIGICSYEACLINLTGTFLSNVTEVHYAGYNGINNNNCSSSSTIVSTSINGAPSSATTSIVTAPTATLANSNGYGSIICGYSCSNNTNQGGCNTVDQVEAYFLGYFAGSTLFAHKVQYGCWTGTQSLSIGGNCCPPPSATVNPGVIAGSQTVCAGSYSAFTSSTPASGGIGTITYTWQWSTTSPTSGFSDIPFTNVPATSPLNWPWNAYYRRAASTNTNNISYSNVLTVLTNPVPAVFGSIIGGSSGVCSGATATLHAGSTGATSYTWQPGNLIGVTVTVTAIGVVVYTVTGSSPNNCTATGVQAVAAIPLPTISTIVSPAIICAGAQATLVAQGGVSYTWMPGPVTAQTLVVTPTASLIYTVTGFDSNCKNNATVQINISPAPVVTLTADRSKLCRGETAVLTASGGTAYAWVNPGISSTTASVAVSPTLNTSYSVVVTGTNGCADIAVKTITVSGCTDVENVLSQNHFNCLVYPNPTRGEFNISAGKQMILEIISDTGQLVAKVQLEEKNNYSVSVTHLAAGIYFIVSSDHSLKQRILIME